MAFILQEACDHTIAVPGKGHQPSLKQARTHPGKEAKVRPVRRALPQRLKSPAAQEPNLGTVELKILTCEYAIFDPGK